MMDKLKLLPMGTVISIEISPLDESVISWEVLRLSTKFPLDKPET